MQEVNPTSVKHAALKNCWEVTFLNFLQNNFRACVYLIILTHTDGLKFSYHLWHIVLDTPCIL
jgi:hypothetical protein